MKKREARRAKTIQEEVRKEETRKREKLFRRPRKKQRRKEDNIKLRSTSRGGEA